MTKYVNQDVFDASLLLAAADYLDSGSELQLRSTVGQLVQYYQNDYVGDYLFRNQLIEMAPKLVKKFEKNPKAVLIERLKFAADVRMQLDDNMKRKSSLKKMFGGTAFTSGHTNPNVRAETGLINAEYLVNLVMSGV